MKPTDPTNASSVIRLICGNSRLMNVLNRPGRPEESLPHLKRGGRLSLMIDWSQCVAVERNPNKVSGAWVFKGTRVPVRALFENLQGGARVEDFLEWFPGVTPEQVNAVLHHAEASLVTA